MAIRGTPGPATTTGRTDDEPCDRQPYEDQCCRDATLMALPFTGVVNHPRLYVIENRRG